MIKKLASKIAYENPWMTIREDDVEFSDGEKGKYYVLEKSDAAIVIPILGDEFVMVSPYRYTTGESRWEFPCGAVSEESAAPEQIARQELSEETGYRAGHMTHLKTMFVADGYSNQHMHVFTASELEAGDTNHEPGEIGMEMSEFTASEIDAMIASDEIKDSQTIAAWGIYRLGQRTNQDL